MRIAVLLSFPVIMIACQSAPSNQQSAESEASAHCYRKVTGRDTFVLQLVVNDGDVKGVLEYDFHEKDGNTGTVDGALKDNIFRGTYHFKSEGVTSDRPVIFKMMGDQLYEALADSADANGVPVFAADDARLHFDPSPYTKAACE